MIVLKARGSGVSCVCIVSIYSDPQWKHHTYATDDRRTALLARRLEARAKVNEDMLGAQW